MGVASGEVRVRQSFQLLEKPQQSQQPAFHSKHHYHQRANCSTNGRPRQKGRPTPEPKSAYGWWLNVVASPCLKKVPGSNPSVCMYVCTQVKSLVGPLPVSLDLRVPMACPVGSGLLLLLCFTPYQQQTTKGKKKGVKKISLKKFVVLLLRETEA